MKKQITTFVLVLLFAYLFGCFISVSFDISKWNIVLRGVVALLGATSSLFITICQKENN